MIWSSAATATVPFLSGCDFYAGALFLDRERPKHTTLLVTASDLGVSQIFDAHEFNFDSLAPGYDFRLQKRFATFFANGRVFGRHEWEDNANRVTSFNGMMSPATPPLPPAVLLEASAEPTYRSNLWSCEGNLGYYLGPTRIAAYAGYRFLFINEHLNLHFVNPTNLSTNADLKTKNHIRGPQVGISFSNFQLPFALCSRLRLSGFVSSFKYTNKTHANYFFSLFNNDNFFANSNADISGKGLDGGLDICFVLMRHLSLNIGYEILWLERVATATEQIPQTHTDTHLINIQSQSLLYQGLQAGIHLVW